jgi:hypothetical protein
LFLSGVTMSLATCGAESLEESANKQSHKGRQTRHKRQTTTRGSLRWSSPTCLGSEFHRTP